MKEKIDRELETASEEGSDAKGKKKSLKSYIISMTILAISVLVCVIVTVQTLTNGYVNIFGYSVFRVVTGSMEPTIPVGAVLLSRSADVDEIEVGDIICFRSRESSHYGSIVTHRVVSISEDESGKKYLESRGDANYSSDPYFVQAENLIGKVIWYTGKEGVFSKVLSFASGKIGFLALIVIPILLIAGLILYGVGRNIRGELDDALDKLSKRKRQGENRSELPKEEDLLPGYSTLTKKDYDDIYETLKSELWKELYGNEKVSEGKTEYKGEKDSSDL
ncbi:MAG: signal peptidase I [Clostridia bacterium]|nr:signal peptidase I [Clostridia bacterium]